MKKSLTLTLIALGILCIIEIAQAQTPVPTVAPYTKTTAVTPPGDKQQAQRLDDCEAQAQKQNIPESQQHSFLNACTQKKLSSMSNATLTPPSTVPTLAPASTITPGTPPKE